MRTDPDQLNPSNDPRPEENRRRILRRPERPFRPALPQTPALAFDLAVSVDPARAEHVFQLLGRSPLLDRDHLVETRLSVVLGGGLRRITAASPGAFGGGFSLLSAPDGGAVFIDTATRTFLHMDPGQALPLSFEERGALAWRVVEENQVGPVLEVRTEAPEPVRSRLQLDRNPALRPYAREVAKTVLGCQDCAGIPLDAWAELGTVVSGETFAGGGDGEPSQRPISSFQVSNARVRPFSEDEIAIPQDHQDLRGEGPFPETAASVERRHVSSCRRPSPSAGADLAGAQGAGAAATIFAPPTENVPVPQCLPSTYGALVAAHVEQGSFDILKQLVDLVSKRLTSFHGRNGKLSLDWLDQFKAFHDKQPGGDAVYCLLREPPTPGDPDPKVAVGGRGLLDRLAEARLVDHLRRGDLPKDLMLAADVQGEVTRVSVDLRIKEEDRYASMATDLRVALREAYTTQILGTQAIDYPGSTGFEPLFYDLLRVRLDDIELDLTVFDGGALPLQQANVDNGFVFLKVAVPDARGRALISRAAGPLYWAGVLFGPAFCWIVPGLCAVVPFIATVGLFLTYDVGRAEIELSELEASATIAYEPNTTPGAIPFGVLVPRATVAITSSVHVSYRSFFPSGLHQIVGELLSWVADRTGIVLDTLQQQASERLTALLRDGLRLVFPADLGPVSVASFTSVASGRLKEFLYLEARLNGATAPVVAPFVTQVEAFVRSPHIEGREAFLHGSGHLLGGAVLSQNFLNLYLRGLFGAREFVRDLDPAYAREVFDILQRSNPAHVVTAPYEAHVFLATPPRAVLSPRGLAEGGGYVTVFFDDVRLCVSGRKPNEEFGGSVEIRFASRARGALGFGGQNPDTNKLDLLRFKDRMVDVYVAPASIAVIEPQSQEIASGLSGVAAIDASVLGSMQDLMRRSMVDLLASRSDAVVPILPGDPATKLTYEPFMGLTLEITLIPRRGIVYAYLVGKGSIFGALGLLAETQQPCEAGRRQVTL